MAQVSQSYHHGDLRQTLINTARSRIAEHGVGSLSLRKLAEDAGVSRTAPYHHFKDKSALLSAIAAEGFTQWQQVAREIFDNTELSARQRFRTFIHRYIGFAAGNPELYELMFGRPIWQSNSATDDLKSVAYPCFQFQVEMTRYWQAQGLLPQQQDPLRLAQVTWGTLHGIARLLIDGIYADQSHIDDMCDCAADVFMRGAPHPHE
ncbi:TetR/AcrR family transcriptional regulator [Alteromonas halophila]|uniref:TetR family transcriptional regulator n=1 Tax=Alteromonas halophila TaxID=516698 RepID=A0A918JRA6_9ALTE|nr:TetR/AcrR family transcriptional regulator [Alteromonas halophila]GGW95002.1 TetR family transcriptional regulator [Alteromonas halophila]